MTITINIEASSETERLVLQTALQNIATKANKESLLFLSEIASKPDINKKLLKKQGTIRKYL